MAKQQDIGQYWTPIYNVFNPWRWLWGTELEAFFVEREDSPLKKLVLEMHPDRVALQTVLTGHRGSGKTSELAKFAQLIQDQYFVIWLDLETSAGGDIHALSQLDVLSMMGFAVYKIAEAGLSSKPDKTLRDELEKSLATLIREETEKEDFEIDVSQILGTIACFGIGLVGGPVAATAAGKVINGLTSGAPFTLGAAGKTLRKLEMSPRLSEVILRVQAIVRDVEDKAGKPLFLIVDGLDKVDNLAHAHALFADSWVLHTPPCRAIYTAPIVLCYHPDYSQVRSRFPTVEFPNVKLHESGQPDVRYERGWQTMREVVHKRLQSLGMATEDVIAPEALDLLVGMSGGVMRQLISLMRDAILEAEVNSQRRVDRLIARKAAYSEQRKYSRPLGRTEFEELQGFLVTHRRSGTEVGDNLILNLYILSYVNDSVWYDLHPLVRMILQGFKTEEHMTDASGN